MPNPKRILLKSIYKVAESLGAETNTPRKLPKKLQGAPAFIAEYHCNFVWPKRATFDAPGTGDIICGMLGDPFDLSIIDLGGNVERMPEDYNVPDADAMDVFGIGTEGGGNQILLLDGHDSKPQNPTVFLLDHELQSAPVPICDLWQFVKFLVPSR